MQVEALQKASSQGRISPGGFYSRSRPSDEDTQSTKTACKLPAIWAVCLLMLVICIVSTSPVMILSVATTNQVGTHLLLDAAHQRFEGVYCKAQIALDEADHWISYVESWLRHATAIPTPSLERELKGVMLPWIQSAKRVQGLCVTFVEAYGPEGGWHFCASRCDRQGFRELFWEYVNGTNLTKVRMDTQWNLLDTVASWPVYPQDHPAFSQDDSVTEWLAPWVQTKEHVGQQRTVRTGGRRVVNFLWIEAAHWGKVVANNTLGLEGASSETSATFVFSRRGTLIATSCRTDDLDHTLLNASDSTCAIVRQTYEWLRNAGHEDHRGYRGRGELELGSYFICMRQLVTSTGEATPYFIVSSYPLSSVERPVQEKFVLLFLTSLGTLFCVTAVALVSAWFLLAKPLRHLESEMDNCVKLDIRQRPHRCKKWLNELVCIFRNLSRMKATLVECTKFVPLEVVKHSLAHGSPIELSMTPTQATIFFLDIESFTRLTETTHTRYLVDNLTLFFERLSNIIVQHRGFIDKYIGDSIMAIWNTPDRLLDHEFQACRAALECLEAAKTPHPGMLLLRARVGMETGPVYAGIFGSLHRMNYTVVGDTVNVASRLEGLNKEHGTEILIGPEMHRVVQGRVHTRELCGVTVKGKAEKMVVYELLSIVDTTATFSFADARGSSVSTFADADASCISYCPDPHTHTSLSSNQSSCQSHPHGFVDSDLQHSPDRQQVHESPCRASSSKSAAKEPGPDHESSLERASFSFAWGEQDASPLPQDLRSLSRVITAPTLPVATPPDR